MKKISLLPAEVKYYNSTSKKRNSLIITSLVILTLFVLSYLGLSLAVLQPQQQLKATMLKRVELQGKIAGMKQYEEAVNKANLIEATISEAMGNNPDWGVLLKAVFNRMPRDVWVTGFSVQYQNNTGILSITGKARYNKSVSSWLSQLEEAHGMKDVKCVFASKDETNGLLYVSYEITADILQGGTYQLPATGGQQ